MKTPFTSHILKKAGQYLILQDPSGRWPLSTFIARFKYSGPITMSKFKKELINNHTVEDYLYELNVRRKAPLDILRTKNPIWYNNLIEQFKNKHNDN